MFKQINWTATKLMSFFVMLWLFLATIGFFITKKPDLIYALATLGLGTITILMTGKNYFQKKEKEIDSKKKE